MASAIDVYSTQVVDPIAQQLAAEAVWKLFGLCYARCEAVEVVMSGYIEGVDRDQATLFPERLEDWIDEDHLVRVVDLFVDELDLNGLGFGRVCPSSERIAENAHFSDSIARS